jgi:hypothetical protein
MRTLMGGKTKNNEFECPLGIHYVRSPQLCRGRSDHESGLHARMANTLTANRHGRLFTDREEEPNHTKWAQLPACWEIKRTWMRQTY